jgi:molybdate transport repressor ModE-like protein
MDWDEVRYFLAVAQEGSVRAAAERLGVNHSTILRRMAQLESQLGAILFEKMPSGYRLTRAGEEIIPLAEQMETASNQLQARISGRDQGVRGTLRVTMPSVLASHLLMPDLATFARRHPELEMEILSADEPVNLTNREADVAVRTVYDRDTLPPNLHGVEGPKVVFGVYMARTLLAARQADDDDPVRWIVKNRYGQPDWTKQGDFRTSDILFRITDTGAQIAAVREGFGITMLPCFMGDRDALLVRVPGSRLEVYGTLWTLAHGETRKTKRVRLFMDFLNRRLAIHASLLGGESAPE